MSSVKNMFRDDKGMTLAEVLIAAGIVTFGLVALIGVMPLSTSQIKEASLKTTATFLAQQRLEQIKNARWSLMNPPDTLGGGGSNGDAAVAEWPDEAAVASYPQFQRQVRIRDCSIDPGCGIPVNATASTLRQVTVTVSFSPMTGVGMFSATPESVQLVTFITQRP